MKKRIAIFALCLALAVSALFSASGCNAAVAQAADLMAGVKVNAPKDAALSEAGVSAAADFGLRLFQEILAREEQSKNALVSPLSVLMALAMTANGARGQTRAQMEAVLGLPAEELNAFLYAYAKALPAGEKYRLRLANSIWFEESEGFRVEEDFLQTNADYYGAGLYRVPFDEATLRAINAWVKEHTEDMIEDILDNIPENAVMYLVNALAFEAEWQSVYTKWQVSEAVFTTEGGEERAAELMFSREHRYLEDENATGFLKYYADGKYAFAALLPNEGVAVSQYAASLTGARLLGMLSGAREVEVNAAIPKFTCEYGADLSAALTQMGMADAFDLAAADFTGIGVSDKGPLYIGRVKHKTFICMGEQGTRAGAATAVEMTAGSAAPVEEPKSVILDRPFVYMLIDCETNLPFFIGTMMDLGA